jgi:energy-converting hydrogenase B subunit D
MNMLLGVVLVLVALSGTAVVLERDPLHQVMVLGVYGLVLAVLFVTFQAPDVALSQLVVGVVAIPALVLLALVKVRENE